MLRIERMELVGFKSFSDRTEVHFPRGITAVVGPNGCGKSNIGDALNWVLGEQSAKMLRGQQMADVIFNGSEGRKPLGMAEVSLHFAGAEGLPFADQGKIAVTRRLFRDGESEYLLNGARARLKDIQDLLRQGKVGARTYATIEQGKIDQVLNAKPKDRRALIEDAAGVSGYKHKRRLAEMKLEATEANLLRVRDIVREVERQIGSLKRQAAKARRYRKLRDLLRHREQLRFARQALDSDRELSGLRQSEAESRDRESATAAAVAALEAATFDEREALERASVALRGAAEQQHQLELAIDREQAQIVACRERIAESEARIAAQMQDAERVEEQRRLSLEQGQRLAASLTDGRAEIERLAQAWAEQQAELERATAELKARRQEIDELRRGQFTAIAHGTDLRNRERNLLDTLERIALQRSRIEAENAQVRADALRLQQERHALSERTGAHEQRLGALRAAHEEREQQQQACRAAHRDALTALGEAREVETSLSARRDTLEDLETRFAGVSDGVRSLLASAPRAGIRTHGVLADYVETTRDVEAMAEGYLHWLLPAVIVEDDADARAAAALLRREDAGRTFLLSRTQPAGALAVGSDGAAGAGETAAVLRDARVRGRLSDGMTLKTAANGVLGSRIGDAILVDDLATALELHRVHPGADYLTADGDIVYASGLIEAGGRQSGDRGLLAHQRRLNEARTDLGQASRQVQAFQAAADGLQRDLARVEQECADLRLQREQGEKDDLELKLHMERTTEDTERSERRSGVLGDELTALSQETIDLGVRLDEVREQATIAEGELAALEQGLHERLATAEACEIALHALTDRVGHERASLAAHRQRQDVLEAEGNRLASEAGALGARLEALHAEMNATRERASAAATALARTDVELAGHLTEHERAASALRLSEHELTTRQQELAGREVELRGRREELERVRETTRAAEIERARAEAGRQHLDELCRQELGTTATEAAQAVGEQALEHELEALGQQIDDLRQHLERLGPVNMTAIDEFAELEERQTFLNAQRQDLEQSIEALRGSIKHINRQSRERFAEAFEAIRGSFQEIYRLLFNGGRADLRLEEGEDVLECGIEILAQPPGKRLTHVQLLSGGEKALSAIALLFAIFRYEPSPFCLLDEVDAALDDANVARFAKMVREYAVNTQFIIVTHNKLSMETADLLYGVTMQEPGVSKLISLQLA